MRHFGNQKHKPIALFTMAIMSICAMLALAPAADDKEQPPIPNAPDPALLIHGEVTRVLDENTVLIRIGDKHERYDLLGVSAFNRTDTVNARIAIDALSRFVLNEQVAILHDPLGDRNTANKLVGFLYRQPDQTMVNLELVRQGYTRHSSSRMSLHKDVFSHYAKRAETLRRGVWGSATPTSDPNEPSLRDDPQPQPETTKSTAPADRIFVTKHGRKYHRQECPHLTDTATPTTRQKIKTTHEPCKTCKPDAG